MQINNLQIIRPETELRQQYDNKSNREKAYSFALSSLREANYAYKMAYHRFINPTRNYDDPFQKIEWEKDSKGLYVWIHGLGGHPASGDNHLTEMEQNETDFKDVDVFAPFVPEKGCCSLEEAGGPILERILDYVKINPNTPICLLGVSNGSRIALWLETELREKAKGTPVKVSSIAGAIFGSSLVNLAEMLQIAPYVLHPATRKELPFGSERAQNLLKKVMEETTEIRSYDFFATTEDLMVPDITSSLPVLKRGERHFVLQGEGYGHNSIVPKVAQMQMALCKQWMRTNQR